MNTIILSLALALIKWWIGSGVFTRITALVEYVGKTDMSGLEKREYVINAAKNEFGLLTTTGISAVIELYLLNKAPSTTV